MRRFFLIPLLAFGTIAGFASGFHSLHAHRWACHGDWQREAYEQPYAPPAPPPVAPVNVQQAAAPAAAPQTLVIPIIVGVPQGSASNAPTTYVIPTPSAPAQPAPAPAK